jgi:hypothetical protein
MPNPFDAPYGRNSEGRKLELHQALPERERVVAASQTGWCARCSHYGVSKQATVEWDIAPTLQGGPHGTGNPPITLRLCAECADGYWRMQALHIIPHPTAVRSL